jgi:hypothetical protein
MIFYIVKKFSEERFLNTMLLWNRADAVNGISPFPIHISEIN